MNKQDKKIDWSIVTQKKGKEIFNSYFMGWKTQTDVGGNQHVSHYTTRFKNLHYLITENKFHEKSGRRLSENLGNINPYLDYLNELNPNLIKFNIKMFIQKLTEDPEVRKIIVKDNKSIIEGINDLMILYWYSKQILLILKKLTPHGKDLKYDSKELNLFDMFNQINSPLIKTFITLDIEERDMWGDKDNLENNDLAKKWWKLFLKYHSIDDKYLLDFQKIITRYLNKIKKVEKK